jgi:hypothetical protein
MRSRLASLAPFALSVLVLVVFAQGALFASPTVQAPEIDGSSLSSGLGLLSAGALILRSRMRSK